MHVSDIARGQLPEHRLVGLKFDSRLHVMETGIAIYRELGIDLEVENFTLAIPVPQAAHRFYMGAIERYTGIIAFNQWEETR